MYGHMGTGFGGKIRSLVIQMPSHCAAYLKLIQYCIQSAAEKFKKLEKRNKEHALCLWAGG